MPIFHAHIPAQKFSSEEKRALADALNLALHEAMDTPMDDRFVVISEHKDDEFFIHPTFPDLKRSDKRMIVTVTAGTSRTVEQKRKLAELVTRYAVEKVGVSQDDVTLIIYAVPLENMSFGGGKLVSDIDLSMPWVNRYSDRSSADRAAELHTFSRGEHGFGVARHGLSVDRWTGLLEDWVVNEGSV